MLADNDTRHEHTSNGTYDYFEEPSIISVLKNRGTNHSANISEVLRVLEDWRNKYNISVVKECERSDYCSGDFRDLILAYNNIHGYISLLICLFGSLANALNVAVLTRRDLASAPINRLLKWLAVADVFVMMEYVPFAIYRYLLFPGQQDRPFSWAVYLLFHSHFTQILHTASILLTLSLAIWRYIAIKYPSYSLTLCTDRRCTIAIFLSFLLPPILCIPSYIVFTIHKDFAFDKNFMPSRVYFVDSDFDGTLYQVNFWVHAVLIKLLPCLILTVISAWLIRALYRVNTKKKALKGYSACAVETVKNGNGNIFTRKSTKRSKAERRTDRTTKMLLAVLLLFLLTEFPQGILDVASDDSKRNMIEDNPGNITRTLTNLFEEMLLETEVTHENQSNLDFSHFLSALREQNSKNSSNELDFGMLVKLVDGFRSKLNLSRSPEQVCNSYCDGNIRDVILAYNSIHGYLSLIVCFFGSLANALNVAVLTRRDLAAAPINRLLKWLAVADVFVMMEYVPFAIYRYLILPGQKEMPYKWAAYLLFHMHFAQIFHTASICLTLSLAVWRYVAIKYSDKNHILCTERRCSTAILSSFILPPILCIPTYMVFDIHTAIVLDPTGPMILYHVDSDEEGRLYQINFWVHAVVVKLLPCCILTVISLWLIREVYSANQHQKKIRIYNACPTNNKAVKRQCKADRRTNRTTKMLLAVLLLFLVTELPQGILGLMSGLLGRCFFKRCYDLFGELMDALALVNGAINFVLYCSMSRQFRMTFGQMMWRAHLHRWPPPTASHSDGQNTGKSSVP